MSPLVLQGNPESEEKQRRRSIFEEEKKKPSLLEKEIQFKFNPRSFLRKGIFVLLMISIFLAGRWSVNTTISNTTIDDNQFSILSFATSLFSSDKTAEEKVAPEVVPVAEAEDSPTGAVAAETAPTPAEETTPTPVEAPVVEQPAEEEVPESIITTYSKVAVAITNVKHEIPNPEDTNYVKATSFNYVIKNNEDGTIKPDYFVLTVEGYNEEGDRREIPLTTEQKTVKAGKTQEGSMKIPPNGFSVNSATAGSLESVRISLVLFDINEKPMASFTKEFSLK